MSVGDVGARDLLEHSVRPVLGESPSALGAGAGPVVDELVEEEVALAASTAAIEWGHRHVVTDRLPGADRASVDVSRR